MNLIVCSKPDFVHQEVTLVTTLFDMGLEQFHFRKPSFSEEECELWLSQIPEHYLKRIVIHQHWGQAFDFQLKGIHVGGTKLHQVSDKLFHSIQYSLYTSTSVHNMDEVMIAKYKHDWSAVWCGPIFDSISKEGYRTPINLNDWKTFIQTTKEHIPTMVYGIGGMNIQTIPKTHQLHLNGLVVLGALWNKVNGIEDVEILKQNYTSLIEVCRTTLS
jgi:thiamine-phosphate pyrophosphorylase